MRGISHILCTVLALGDVTAVRAAARCDTEACIRLTRDGDMLLDGESPKPEKALEKYERAVVLCESCWWAVCASAKALIAIGRPMDALLRLERCEAAVPPTDSGMVDWIAARKKEATASLGQIRIDCDRNGTSIFIDEDPKERGQTPLEAPLAVEPGKRLVHGRWLEIKRSVTVDAKAGEVVDATLRFDPLLGRVSVVSNKEGAVIRIDGDEVGKTPLPAVIGRPPGEHQLEAEWMGQRLSVPFSVKEDASEVVTIEFKDLAPIQLAPPTARTLDVRPWFKSRWVPWVAGGAAVASAIAIGLLCCRQDRYPVPTMGVQSVGE